MTMPNTAPTAAANAQTAPVDAPAPAARSTAADRAAALKTQLESGDTSQSAAESSDSPSTGQPSSSTADSDAAPETAVPDPHAQARADRLARIAQVRAKENADDQERQQRQSYRAKEGEIEKLRKQIADLEPLNGVFKDEESILAEAERRGMSAEKLITWMRTRITDPQAVAQHQAKTVEDKLRGELQATRDEIQALKDQIAADKEAAQHQQTMTQKTSSFFETVKGGTSTHPLTAAFMTKHGEAKLVAYANKYIAPDLHEDYSLEELHDNFEQHLDEIQVSGSPAASVNPANGSSQPPKKNGAAQPATTLSNALASGRESLVEETPLHQLSREERKRRLRETLEREP